MQTGRLLLLFLLSESQTEGLSEAEQEINQEDFSERVNSVADEHEPSLSTCENAEEDEAFEDTFPAEITEDTVTNININDGENDVNGEASVDNAQDVHHNSESHINNVLERNEFCSPSNSEIEQEVNNDVTSDEDEEIMNRSMFDLNPDSNSHVDANNEQTINSGVKDILCNDSKPNDIINEPVTLENEELATKNQSCNDVTTSTYYTSHSNVENPALLEEHQRRITGYANGTIVEQMDVESSANE